MITVKTDRFSSLGKFIQQHLIAENRIISFAEIILVIAIAILVANIVTGFIGSDTYDTPSLIVQTGNNGQTFRAADPNEYESPSPSLIKLFGNAVATSQVDESIYNEAQLQETQLNLELKGILINAEDGKRLALIAAPGQSEEVYQEGDSIEGAEIITIEPRRVILRHNGRTETLSLEVRNLGNTSTSQRPQLRTGRNSNGIRRISDRERIIPRETFNRQLNNLPRLLQQARAVPHTEGGQAKGFRLVDIQSGSIFEDLGLQAEDIIHSVNGRQILSVEDALNTYRELRTSRSFQVGVLRSGSQVTLNLSVQ